MPPKLATTFLCLAIGAASVRAEKPRSIVRENAAVTLVEVPVNVVGRDGKPVHGLGPADFEIEDDGVRQPIESVDVVDLTKKTESPSPPSDLPAAGRRHFLLLFDFSFSTATQIARARDAARRFIETGLAPEDLAAVATTSVDQGARLLVTFTSDRHQLTAAIRELGLPRTEERGVDPLAFALIVPGDPFLSHDPTGERTRSAAASLIDPGSARIYTVMARKSADNYSESRVQQHLSGMGAFAFALNAVEGRKTIIYFSEGFDSRLLLGSLARERSREDTMADNDAILEGRLWALDLDRRSANSPLHRQMDETLALFRRSDCVVYPIDIGGLKAEGDVALGGPHRGEDALFAFASGTGGELLRNANDLDLQMRRIADRTSLTYVLTFRPTKVAGEGKFHVLKVRVRRKGARASARAGYYETRIFRSLTPLERALSAADVITHEKKQSDFGVDVLALALNEDPISRVPVVLQVSGRELLREGPTEKLTVGIYVYAVDEGGRLADFFSRAVQIDVSRDGDRLRGGGLRYYGSLRLAPGKYRIRSFVRDEERGRFAFRVVPLEVPAPEAQVLRAFPPIFVDFERPGISLRDATRRKEGAASASEPFELAGDVFVPRLRPELSAATPTRLCLLLYAAAADPQGSLVRLEAWIRDAKGHSSAPAQFSVIGRTAPDASGLWKLLVEFAPQALPPGDYSLRVIFRDSVGTGAAAETEAPFRIL